MSDRLPALPPAGRPEQRFTDLIVDFTGTLSRDGVLLPGVAERLRSLAQNLRITVLTADTFGTAVAQLDGLPVKVRIVETGAEKAEVVRATAAKGVIAIGNGRNDAPLLQLAELAIAVVGPEGAAAELLRVADVVVRDIADALDLILHPLRLKATLRE
ncbi:ATPase P [bacterium]|nr:ATPase P [bacterium]